ncbi:hypothetical protein ACWD25_22135 [Streptomyces sp. NPDC002920]
MISRIVVLARNFEDFRAWCRDSGLSPTDPEVVYIDRWDRLRGLGNIKVIRCPRWDQRPDVAEIDELARELERRRAHGG